MERMVKCEVCRKQHEYQNFKTCNRVTACAWCMSKGTAGVTTCNQCKQREARPADL
jgi:hypothetical protein